MKRNQKNTLCTRRLLLTLKTADDLSEKTADDRPDDLIDRNDPFLFLVVISEKKSGQMLGTIRSASAGAGTAEIDLSLCAAENGEALAAEALRGGACLLFRHAKKLMKIETWLNPDLFAIRILEKAGYERVFEKDGVVRYEKNRPFFPFLAAFMLFFTLLGVLFGYLFDNYPLFVAVGIAAGVLPGALAASAARRRRSALTRAAK